MQTFIDRATTILVPIMTSTIVVNILLGLAILLRTNGADGYGNLIGAFGLALVREAAIRSYIRRNPKL